jgi:hypothetical protein
VVTLVHRATIFVMLAVVTGMRERAELIGGNLEVSSRRQSGTEVELNIPAAVGYAASPTGRRSRLVTRMPFAKQAETKS